MQYALRCHTALVGGASGIVKESLLELLVSPWPELGRVMFPTRASGLLAS